MYWKRTSKAPARKPKVAEETITLIRKMARENRLWGAERIRGELLKLGMHVCKRTVQKYMRNVRSNHPPGQKWATFLHNHAAQFCSFDRSQAFFLIELQSRKVVHIGVTRSPTDVWVARTASGSYPVWAGSEVSDTR